MSLSRRAAVKPVATAAAASAMRCGSAESTFALPAAFFAPSSCAAAACNLHADGQFQASCQQAPTCVMRCGSAVSTCAMSAARFTTSSCAAPAWNVQQVVGVQFTLMAADLCSHCTRLSLHQHA